MGFEIYSKIVTDLLKKMLLRLRNLILKYKFNEILNGFSILKNIILKYSVKV